jgi:hypothetical protein
MKSLWPMLQSWLPSFLPARRTVGWLCSVTKSETKELLKAFKDGLDGDTDTVDYNEKYANGDYEKGNITTLTQHAESLMDDRVDVLVATGGVASLQAAVQAAKNKPAIKIPILYIVGLDLNDASVQHENISGGINLNMPTYDAQRANELQAHYGATKIGLLVNGNARMGPEDKRIWQNGNWGPVEERGNGEKNANIPLAQAIQNLINQGVDAIVVSGDPYYTSKRNALVPILNSKNLKAVSYPFDIYKTQNPPPTSGKSMRFGPGLEKEYKNLGVKAYRVLCLLINPIPKVDVDKAPNNAVYWGPAPF